MRRLSTPNFENELTSNREKNLNFEIIPPLKNQKAANKEGE